MQVKVSRPPIDNTVVRNQFLYGPSMGVVQLHSALLTSYYAIENALLKTANHHHHQQQQQQHPFHRLSAGRPGGNTVAGLTGVGPAAEDAVYRCRLPPETASVVERYTQELSNKMCRLIVDKKAASGADNPTAATTATSGERRNNSDYQTRL
jgi:hypothetical protein